MQKILVTGAGGYIGSHAVKRLLREGYAVVAFDNFSRGFREPLQILKKYGPLQIAEGDLLNPADLDRAFAKDKIEAVMHFAALCLVDESTREPELYFKNNVTGTENLLRAMQKFGADKIIFSSTCAVYGNAEYLPVDEKHPTRPLNPYGESKLKAEELIRESGLSYAILRYFNVCGADGDGEIGDGKKPSELLVQNAVRGALGIEPFKLTCPLVDTPDGTPVRDYVDVEDIVDAHIKALKYLENHDSLLCNLGSGRGQSVKEIIDAVKKELGAEFNVAQSSPRQGEYAKIYADNSMAKNALGWQPGKTLKESINSLAAWYRSYPGGYED